MTNAKMIDGLRWCADESICCDDFSGEKCPYFDEKKDSCSVDEILHAAADALEAQAKRIEELNTKCADLQSQINSMESEIEELLPKEGEWMKNIRWYYQHQTQSTTTNVGTTFLCRSTGKLCPNATEYGYCKQTVCNVAARG